MTDIPPEIKKGRNQLAAVIVIGHALKHVYMGGFQAVILPEIKIGLSLSATQLGAVASSRQAMGWISTMGAGYLGDRYPERSSLILGIVESAPFQMRKAREQ